MALATFDLNTRELVIVSDEGQQLGRVIVTDGDTLAVALDLYDCELTSATWQQDAATRTHWHAYVKPVPKKRDPEGREDEAEHTAAALMNGDTLTVNGRQLVDTLAAFADYHEGMLGTAEASAAEFLRHRATIRLLTRR